MARTPRPRVIQASGGGLETTLNQTTAAVDPIAIVDFFRRRNLTKAQEAEALAAAEEERAGFEALARVAQPAFGTVPTGEAVGPAPTVLEGLAPTPAGAASEAGLGVLGQLTGTPIMEPRFDIPTLAGAFGTKQAGPFISRAAETILPTGIDAPIGENLANEFIQSGLEVTPESTIREVNSLVSARVKDTERAIPTEQFDQLEEVTNIRPIEGQTFNQYTDIVGARSSVERVLLGKLSENERLKVAKKEFGLGVKYKERFLPLEGNLQQKQISTDDGATWENLGSPVDIFSPRSLVDINLGGKPARAGELKELTNLYALSDEIGTLETLFDPRYVGAVDNIIGGLKEITGLDVDTKQVTFRRIANGIADSLLRAKSGAQINEQEFKRLMKIVPDPRLSDSAFTARMKDFDREIKNIIKRKEEALRASGFAIPRAGAVIDTEGENRRKRIEELRGKAKK